LLGFIHKINSTPLLGRLEVKNPCEEPKENDHKAEKLYKEKQRKATLIFFWFSFSLKQGKTSLIFLCFGVLIDAKLKVNMQLKQKKTNQKKKENMNAREGENDRTSPKLRLLA